MENFFRVAKLVDQDLFACKGIVDPGRSLSSVGDSDHNRRGAKLPFLPCLRRFQPISAQEGVTHTDQLRKRLLLLGLPVEIVLYMVVDMVEL